MIFIALILAIVFTFGIFCLMMLIGLYSRSNENFNWILLLAVFVVVFVYIDNKLDSIEFCESAVLKICPSDRTGYIR